MVYIFNGNRCELRAGSEVWGLEAALKIMGPIFSEARAACRYGSVFVDASNKARLKSLKARKRGSRHVRPTGERR
jgi:hypothetical protein